MRDVVVTEFWKLRRSGVTWTTAGVIVVAVLGAAFLTWIVRDPARAASLGLLGAKANLAGLEATWPAFGSYLTAIAGGGGMLLLAFIVTYLVGREYVDDDTSKNMLGLPVPRWQFLVAKLVVSAVWWAALVVLLLATGLAAGLVLGLPGMATDTVATTVGGTLLAGGASFLLVPMCAWITVATRSYLAALGFAVGMLLLGNLIGHTGWATWFPWSIVPMLTLMTGSTPTPLPWTSLLVLGLTFAAGTAGAIHRLNSADNP